MAFFRERGALMWAHILAQSLCYAGKLERLRDVVAYLPYGVKSVVAVWGGGINDAPEYTRYGGQSG